jgi:uncharacterized protein (TIGR02391 family)
MSLYNLLPDAGVLLGLEPEELAAVVLQDLNSLPEPERHQLNRRNYAGQSAVREYPANVQREVQKAIMEAWSWLMREGFLADAPQPMGETVFLTRRGKKAADPEAFRKYKQSAILPRARLHPAISDRVWPAFLRGDYDTAIFQAYREVEVAVRRRARLPAELVGQKLMRKAFQVSDGVLSDQSLPDSERQAVGDLFAGAIGWFKNPHSHRHVPVEADDAAEAIALASYLLRIVDNE